MAQILSVIFHPLLVPSYLYYLLLYVMPDSMLTFPLVSRWLVMLLVFISTFLIPTLGTLALVRTGYVKSMLAEERSERSWPLFFTTVCFAMATYMFYREQVFDDLLYAIMAVITMAVFLTFIISRFWKISAHSIGMGGALGFMLLLHTWQPEQRSLHLVSGTILMSGAVLSARLALDAHTPLQVYTGFFLGLTLSTGIGILV
ncbi:hypothetical protein AHMF7616_00652 [Adhaeribacter pallidiroseus]|uniref:Phosphatidic acid phosphatase type 2/haloperoxidase domain-containing protein n=1 Tax=Adhaeribacter pallidiroseus TaxID=2072847 RepID=A0A369QAW7_9BACT|nr:hypothetical protein AHMF7616_00652 [Adhaeribacter pallidiroseus]